MVAVTTVALTSVGAVVAGLWLLRRWRSAKWGVCSLATRLRGQVIVVTGGNVGLGAEAALDLARRGATVVLACRSWDNTRDTLARIRAETGNNDVHYLHLDLGSLASVRQFAADVTAKFPEVHVLVCNAGVWHPMDQAARTSDGFEAHAGVNHLGHHLLTRLLLDSSLARVVVVSSSLCAQGKLDFTEYDHFRSGRLPEPGRRSHAPTGYCDSKLMNVLFTKELASRRAGRGLTAVSVCPGWCYTNLARHTGIKFYQVTVLELSVQLIMDLVGKGLHLQIV